MARIPLIEPDSPDLEPEVRRIFAERVLRAEAMGMTPRVLNVTRALANHPAALRAVQQLGEAGYASGSLEPPERELAFLTTAVVNDCHY